MSKLELIFAPSCSQGVIAAKLWIKGGSREDPFGQKGLHQLLGSVLSRGCGPYNNISLADLVEGYGAGLRCDVNEDGFLISLKCSNQNADQLLPILGWMMWDPHLENDQVTLERDLSLQALQRQKENPFHIAFDGWRQITYKNGPYGHDPLGIEDDLLKLGRHELIPLASKMKTRASVLVIAGDIDQKTKEEISKVKPFDSLIIQNQKENFQEEAISHNEAKSFSNSTIHTNFIQTKQVVMMLGQSTIPHGHQDDLALRLMNCHLSAGMSSLLFKRLREEHGVAYDVGVHHPFREGNAPFVLHASTTEDKSMLTLELLLDCWWELSERTITEQALSLAKAKFKGLIAHSSQTSGQRAERKAQLKAFGLPLDYDLKSLQLINSLSSNELQTVAQRHLMNPLLSLCGTSKALKKLKSFWENKN